MPTWHRYRIQGKEYVSARRVPAHDLVYLEREGPEVLKRWGLTLVRSSSVGGAGSRAIGCNHPRSLRATGPATECRRCRTLLPGGTKAYTCNGDLPQGNLPRECQAWYCKRCSARPAPAVSGGEKTVLLSDPPAAGPGYLEQSADELQEEVQYMERLHGPHSLNTATSTAKLGWTQIATNGAECSVDNGISNLEATLETLTETVGDVEANIATCLSQQGWGLLRSYDSNAGEAVPQMRNVVAQLAEAVQMQERSGSAHSTAVAQTRLGVALSVDHQHEVAVATMRKALSTLQRLWGDLHPDTGIARSQLGWVLWQAGLFNEAGAELSRALHAIEITTGKDSVPCNICRMRLADVFREYDDRASALVLLETAERNLHETLGPGNALATRCSAELRELREGSMRGGGRGEVRQGDLVAELRKERLSDLAIQALRDAGVRSLEDVSQLTRADLKVELPLADRSNIANLCTRLSVKQWLHGHSAVITE